MPSNVPVMVTLAEACRQLNWGDSLEAQNRLYNRLRRAEARTGTAMLISIGRRGSPVRVAWHHIKQVTRTTSAIERVSAPEWQASIDELDTHIAAIADRRIDLRVVPHLAKVEENIEVLASGLESLRNCVETIVGVPKRSDKSPPVWISE